MNLQIIEIISLVIRIAAVFVVYRLLKDMVERIDELEKDIEYLTEGEKTINKLREQADERWIYK